MEAAAHSLNFEMTVLDASNESEIDRAFVDAAEHKMGALLVNTGPFLLGQRQQIVGLAARLNIPTVYFLADEIRPCHQFASRQCPRFGNPDESSRPCR